MLCYNKNSLETEVQVQFEKMSPFLKTIENEVQIAALLFLVVVYLLRLRWLFKFRSRKERTFAAGKEREGIAYSLLNVAMPWAMESARKNPFFYAQFIIFHIGVAAAIGATFVIPYWPSLFKINVVVRLFQVFIAAAFFVSLIRLYRRISNPALRLISSLDDYLSLILMILFFAAGVVAVPNRYEIGEWPLILFFGLTAFLLVYVPFSKIGHYLYYPISRFFLGRTLGHRGVFPVHKSPKDKLD
jgi:nitrate reductase gamma subunit